MQYEPALVMAIALPVAFSWRTFWEVYSIEVEIFETGEGEAEEGAGGDEEEREVVAFAEAQWVVDFARESDKGIWRLWGWSEGCHLVDWRWCCRRLEGRRCVSNKRRLNTAVIYQERASQPHCLARNIKFHRYRNVSFRSQSAVFRPYCDGRR